MWSPKGATLEGRGRSRFGGLAVRALEHGILKFLLETEET